MITTDVFEAVPGPLCWLVMSTEEKMSATLYDPDHVVTIVTSQPTDQSGQIATLTAQVASLQARLAAVKGDVDKAEADVSAP